MIKQLIFCSTLSLFVSKTNAQVKRANQEHLATIAKQACECVDSIEVMDKSKVDISTEIGTCVDNVVTVYQLNLQLTKAMEQIAIENVKTKDSKKKKEPKSNTVEILIDPKDSEQYKNYYYEIERYLMDSCTAMREKMASDELLYDHSISKNEQAMKAYILGVQALNSSDFASALPHFKQAIEHDEKFAFAWDNLGICYRQLGEYDKAIYAYKQSLFIEPKGITPLLNMAVAYSLKQEWDSSISVYEKMISIYPNNPEGYFGKGKILTIDKEENSLGLDFLCKAYNLYVAQKSPYRTDAEGLLGIVYDRMKEEGKDADFFKILKKNNIVVGE